MNHISLTPAQQKFAAKNHSLVYGFLDDYGLNIDEYYDIVIFGYLRAVKRYLSIPSLAAEYAFSTIAWGAMRADLTGYRNAKKRQKRSARVVSLSNRSDLPAFDSATLDLETDLLLLDLASKVSKKEMKVINMRMDGYSVRDIAKDSEMKEKEVCDLLDGIKDTVHSVCAH